MKTPFFIEKIDWSELRNQKTALINHIAFLRKDQSEVNQIDAKNELADHLEGILGLIDAVQDYAVDEMGMNGVDIYDFELEAERDEETKEEKFARENARIIFEMHIEGSFIYENEVMSKEFIKSIIDDEQHASAIKAIMRNSILEDVQNGIITSLEYDIEMYDYGYKIEDYCMEQFYKDKTKQLYVCSDCGGDRVHQKKWIGLNDSETVSSVSDEETNDNWCDDCDGHCDVLLVTMPYLRKVIGYQVVGGYNGVGHIIIHPNIFNNKAVYSLSQALEMIDNNNSNCWRLQSIWSDDIDEPQIMFEGNPRD